MVHQPFLKPANEKGQNGINRIHIKNKELYFKTVSTKYKLVLLLLLTSLKIRHELAQCVRKVQKIKAEDLISYLFNE